MNNKKATKRALLTSITALVMCVVMLAGTTFAWFTDTATANVNKIQAGTLDVELVKPGQENGEYVPLGTTPLKWVKATGHEKDEVLWEPGCTYNLESFRIQNKGSLALKYQVQISGIIGNAKLLEAIDFAVKVEDGNLDAKDSAKSVPTTVADLNNFEGTLAANSVTGKITITGAMKESAGNEYKGLSIDGIAITVVAAQDTVEYDSKTKDYDKGAAYPVVVNSAAELADAISAGTEDKDIGISLASDMAFNSAVTVPQGKNVTIQGNGNTIKMTEENASLFKVSGGKSSEGSLVLDNVVLDGENKNLGQSFPIDNGGNVEISNCTIKNFSGTRAVHSEQADTVKISNTTFENITLTGESSPNSNTGRACLLWLQGTNVVLEDVTIKNCKVLTGNNTYAGSGILIYARNSGTNVTARNLVVENNIVTNHVFATYSTTKDNNYVFESGSIKGNTIGNSTDRSDGEIFMVGNLVVGKDMVIEQNITFNNDSNNGVCTLTNNGEIVGKIAEAEWAKGRGYPIYTGTGTHTGEKTNITVK